MTEPTVLRDGDGNYHTFPPEVLAAARTGEGTYELDADAVDAARVPDDDVDAVESSIASLTDFGMSNLRPNLGDTGDATYR